MYLLCISFGNIISERKNVKLLEIIEIAYYLYFI